jgi:hypothetical protein
VRQVLSAAAIAALLAGLSVPGATGATSKSALPVTLPAGSATALASPDLAGAQPTALTLTLRFRMTCGRPGAGPIVVSLPAAENVPRAIARSDVLVGGKPPLTATISGHTVTLTLPRSQGVTCMVIAPGTLTIRFTHAAGLGNPSAAGTYALPVRVGARILVARLTVKP